jgi:hypothetical protein
VKAHENMMNFGSSKLRIVMRVSIGKATDPVVTGNIKVT